MPTPPAPTDVPADPTVFAPAPRLGGGFFETLLRGVGAFLARLVYRVRTRGLENLPRTGGALLLPNHVTWIDAVVLQLACPRRLRFVIYEPIYNRPLLRPFLKALGCIPISPAGRRARWPWRRRRCGPGKSSASTRG